VSRPVTANIWSPPHMAMETVLRMQAVIHLQTVAAQQQQQQAAALAGIPFTQMQHQANFGHAGFMGSASGFPLALPGSYMPSAAMYGGSFGGYGGTGAFMAITLRRCSNVLCRGAVQHGIRWFYFPTIRSCKPWP